MASCAGCKRRTTSFCFVHKISVCDDCTASKSAGLPVAAAITCEPNDVIGNYFDWLADAEYTWPPRCNLCNRTLTADRDEVVRLVCKDVLHRKCLHEHLSRAISTQHVATAKLQCPSCNLLLVDPATQPRTKLREAVQQFVQQVARGEGAASSNSSSSSSSVASPGINQRAAASPLAASSSSSSASASSGSSAESRYSPAVRELMAKATTAKAALPAGTAHTAIALGPNAAMSSSPPSAVGNGSSSGSSGSGLYSGGSTAVSRNVSALAAASPLGSSSSSSTGSVFSSRLPDDIEAQVDGHKGHKTPRSRFGALRAAATKGGWVRRAFCQWRPQKIVLAVMAVALMMALILYIRFTASMMQEGAAPSLAPADASAAITTLTPLNAATPDMQLLDQQ